MNCPAESKTIDKFEKKGYESSDTTIYRPNGVKIIKAVKLYSQKDDNKTKMKLEELLGQSLSRSDFIDSAWGCKCNCVEHCGCESHHEHCGPEEGY